MSEDHIKTVVMDQAVEKLAAEKTPDEPGQDRYDSYDNDNDNQPSELPSSWLS